MFRGWFLNDAIIDGMQVYLEYQKPREHGQGVANFTMYENAAMQKLFEKN